MLDEKQKEWQEMDAVMLCNTILNIAEERHYSEYTVSLLPEYINCALKTKEHFKLNGITKEYKDDRTSLILREAEEKKEEARKMRRQAYVVSGIAAGIAILSLLISVLLK